METINGRDYILDICKRAKNASGKLAGAGTALKNRALLRIANLLEERTPAVLYANREDLLAAEDNGMKPAMLDRLRLTEQRIAGICEGIRQVAALPDPIGETEWGTVRPNGIEILKKRVPLGVVGIIYEARPNVTADCSSLTLKSGNSVILRGGKEAIRSNIAIASVFREGLADCGLPEDCVILIENTDRSLVNELYQMRAYVDVLIPRGGHGLIASVVENSKIPVIQTGAGNCHTYIDGEFDADMAEKIVVNAKTQRPSVCNAMETLLVSEEAAPEFLPRICAKLLDLGVELRGCGRTVKICTEKGITDVLPANESDYATEFDDLILAVKVVKNVDEAIDHINTYGTGHSECIVTRNLDNAAKFQKLADAACVYVNCSTRFTDGFEFGFGAEIGISNQKLHARGPMGLRELTSVKYFIKGEGQIRG